MYLEATPSWGTYWHLKYRFAGKEKRLALGVYHEGSLKQAREKRDGIDPSAERRANVSRNN